MSRKRSTYTAEFKLQAIQMITDRKHSVAEAARRLDIGENLLRSWKKAFEQLGAAAFPGNGTPSPADDERPSSAASTEYTYDDGTDHAEDYEEMSMGLARTCLFAAHDLRVAGPILDSEETCRGNGGDHYCDGIRAARR